jgi:hypothetical protein
MKALAIVLAVLLVLVHPAAAAAVLTAELAVCAALGWLVWRIVRPGRLYRPWRTA